jgi:hypothetical protein
MMCDVPSMAVFCRESIECCPGTVSRYFCKLLLTIPVALVIVVIIIVVIRQLLFYTASFNFRPTSVVWQAVQHSAS